jgi:hypothetical protein
MVRLMKRTRKETHTAQAQPSSSESSSSSSSSPVEYCGRPAIRHQHCNCFVPYDPKNEELEDITISDCTIRVSSGEIRRARHFEILAKSNEECIKLISELQQLIMRKGCYMLDKMILKG